MEPDLTKSFKCGECPQRIGASVGKEDSVCDKQGSSGKRKRKRSKKASKKKETDGESGDEKVSKKEIREEKAPKRASPNVFVGFQVSNPRIHKAIRKTQDEVVTYDEKLKSALVKIAKSHITLLVARVQEEELAHATEVLKKSVEMIKAQLEGQVVDVVFDGIGTFGNRVIFANPVSGLEEMKLMRDTILNLFTQENVLVTDTKFNPHLTIAKIRGKTKIPSESYSSCRDLHFGSQQIRSIQLLSMTKQPNEKGYYFTEAEFMLDNISEDDEDQDHTQCSSKETLERQESEAEGESEKSKKTTKNKCKDNLDKNKETLKASNFGINHSVWAVLLAGVGIGIACSYLYFRKK